MLALPALSLSLLFFAWAPVMLIRMANRVPLHIDPELLNSKLALVTAHPDDEVMFFGPTLFLFAHTRTNNSLDVLCLSSGNADGIGETRRQEFYQTLTEFFPLNKSALTILDDESRFPDSMDTVWDADDIADAIEQHLPGIDKIITFDDQGVSGHPNHISLYHGALKWQSRNLLDRQVYVLKSVPIWRKYISSLDILLSFKIDRGAKAFILVRKQAYKQIKRAMTKGYKSQMAWFRMGWVILSRYMVVNVLDKV